MRLSLTEAKTTTMLKKIATTARTTTRPLSKSRPPRPTRARNPPVLKLPMMLASIPTPITVNTMATNRTHLLPPIAMTTQPTPHRTLRLEPSVVPQLARLARKLLHLLRMGLMPVLLRIRRQQRMLLTQRLLTTSPRASSRSGNSSKRRIREGRATRQKSLRTHSRSPIGLTSRGCNTSRR